ncbi:MAG: hypothetical protein HUJ73_00580 [Eubacterium sp.]|nr:hypothetical protein [Eubacterium sp.]
MKPVFVICDSEKEYAVRFMEYANTRKIPFEVQVFTGREGLLEYAGEHPVEILLVSQRMMCEEIRNLDAGKLIILSEQYETVSGDISSVYKYQSGAQVIREILDIYSAEQEGLGTGKEPQMREGEFCGVYGLTDPLRQMLFSLTYGQILAEHQPVLYINLQKYSGLQELTGDVYDGDMGDLLYLFRTGRAGFSCRIPGLLRRIGQMDYLPAPYSPEDIGELTGSEWKAFFHQLNRACTHETILLDLGPAVRGTAEIMRFCGKRILLCSEDAFSFQRCRKLEEEWQAGQESVCRLTPPDAIPVQEGKWFLETLPSTEFGSFIRSNHKLM